MAFPGVSAEGSRAGQGGEFRTGQHEYFRGVWAIGMVSACLVSVPGLMKAEEYCFLHSMG